MYKNTVCKNTDKELWRKIPDDYYSPSIHVTEFGDIAINVGGHILTAPIETWYEAGTKLGITLNSKKSFYINFLNWIKRIFTVNSCCLL